MNIQTMMKLAAQHAEEQKKANDANQLMETLRLMIMTTTINDLVNQDAIDKTLQKALIKRCKCSKATVSPAMAK